MGGNKILVCALISAVVLIISGVFSVYMFVKAGVTQDRAMDLDRAMVWAQTVVADFKNGTEIPPVTFFDRDFNVVGNFDEYGFKLEFEINNNNMGLYEIKITVTKNKPYTMEDIEKSTIFKLDTAVYKGRVMAR